MTTCPFAQLLLILVVLLHCPTATSAQALLTSPLTSAASLEDSVLKASFSGSIQIISSSTCSVLPIPASGLVELNGFSYDRYSVLDSQGELWVAGPGTQDRTIDLGHLPDGVYYLHLSTREGEVISKVLLGNTVSRQ